MKRLGWGCRRRTSDGTTVVMGSARVHDEAPLARKLELAAASGAPPALATGAATLGGAENIGPRGQKPMHAGPAAECCACCVLCGISAGLPAALFHLHP
jgi:hypothetical protein